MKTKALLIVAVIIIVIAVIAYYLWDNNSSFVDISMSDSDTCPVRVSGRSSLPLSAEKSHGFLMNDTVDDGEIYPLPMHNLNGEGGNFFLDTHVPHRKGDRICAKIVFVAQNGQINTEVLCINARNSCMPFIIDESLQIVELQCPGIRFQGKSTERLSVEKTEGYIVNSNTKKEYKFPNNNLNKEDGGFHMDIDVPHRKGDRLCVKILFVTEDGRTDNKIVCIEAQSDCFPPPLPPFIHALGITELDTSRIIRR